MKKISLSKGLVALVDDADFDYLNQWKWSVDGHGYAMRSGRSTELVKGKRPVIYMHRVIMSEPTGKQVDHKDGNTLDNRRSNLRVCTASENMRNRRMATRTKSGYKGVWFNRKRGKWIAYIKSSEQSRVLGSFNDKIEAAHVYNQVAEQLFGEFARLNPL